MSFDLSETRRYARSIGLADIGVIRAGASATFERFESWLRRGRAGDMDYLARYAEARRSPESVLPRVKTLLVAVLTETELLTARRLPPADTASQSPETPVGTIIPYAACRDYHAVMKEKLFLLKNRLASEFPGEKFRIGVDTAPLLEKEWASRSGLGAIGRHTLLIHPEFGPSIFLGFLLSTARIDVPAAPPMIDPCVGCRRCVVSCPTGAILPDRSLDPLKCLNYWTIESRGEEIPEAIGQKLGRALFGCDRCRRVCPKNPAPSAPVSSIPLREIETMTPDDFSRRFAETPVERLGLDRLKRNARWIS